MRLAPLLFLVFASLSAACSSLDDTPIKPEPTSPTPEAPPREEAVLLGKPCPDAPPVALAEPYVGCGRDGRIGLVTFGRRTSTPPGARKLQGSMGDVNVVLEGNRVWVQANCPMCRTHMESTMIADLAHATDEQLMQIQMNAELSNKSPLRDTRAWLAALDGWEPRR